jgi:hypothetical protein
MTFEDAVWIGLGIRLPEPEKTMTLDPLTSREQAESEEAQQMDDWAEAQHTALLESYCKALWQATAQGRHDDQVYERSPLERLEKLVKHALKVQRKGVAEDYIPDYQLDLLLTEWGAGKLIAYFGALAETEGK